LGTHSVPKKNYKNGIFIPKPPVRAMARPSFDDAWALLKQINLTDEERRFAPYANPREGTTTGMGTGYAMLQSNLGLFDPSLAIQTVNPNFSSETIRVGRGEPVPRRPEIESQFVAPKYAEGGGGFKLMGVPAGGGKPVQMVSLGGGMHDGRLGNLSGETMKPFRRQGNYEKLMRAILSSGIGIDTTTRNSKSNPFHRKFINRFGDIYGAENRDNEDIRNNLNRHDSVSYHPPQVFDDDGKIITQKPVYSEGKPEGGFGSLARYDFGTLPFRRGEKEGISSSDDGKTEQTLLAEAVLANMNRGLSTPMDMADLLFEGGEMRRLAQMREQSSPMRSQMRGSATTMPPASKGGALKYALGFNAPHRPLATDEETGNPLLFYQPQGAIAQRIDDDIYERERQAEIARREEEERQEFLRRQQVEDLLPNASDLSDPANAPMMAAIQELIRRQEMEQEEAPEGDGFERLASLFS
jgi:hypothetical protein